MQPRRDTNQESLPTYPGWRVVFACFVLAIFSWTFGFYGQSVYVAQLRDMHGWPVATVASAATAYYLVSAGLVVFAGDAIARLGPRRVMAGGIVFLAAGAIVTGQARSLAEVYGAYALIACGWAATSIAAITTAVGAWFDRKRGFAISLALNGASVGGVIGAPALLWASGRFGFPAALAGMATLMLVVVGPILLFVWPRGAPAAEPPGDRNRDETGSAIRSRALRTRRFWTMTLGIAAALFVQVAFVVHLVTLATPVAGERGAGLAMGLLAAAAVIGRVGLGAFIDRMDARRASAGAILVQVFALIVVMTASGYVQLVAGAVLFGLSVGNLITLPALIVHREWDSNSFGAVISLSTAIGQVAYAFGPGLVGWLRDLSGSYTAPLVLCVAVDLLAVALVLAGRPSKLPG